MSNLQRTNEAHERREKFLTFDTRSSIIKMQLLYEIWNNKDWRLLGFDDMKSYFESPVHSGGLGKSRQWVIQLAKTWERYVVQLGWNPEEIAERQLSARKLYALKDKATKENKDEILSLVESATLDYIQQYVKSDADTEDDFIENHEHEWIEWKQCRVCKDWKKG